MRPQRSAWLVCVPLTVVGGLFAHVLGYSLADPKWSGGHAEVAHGYFAYWRLGVAACLTVVLLGLTVAVVQALNARRLPRAPLWLFAVLPPVGFVVQEHLERIIAGVPLAGVPLEPGFLLGLVLQLPFALAAWFVARTVLTFASSLAKSLRSLGRARLAPALPARPHLVGAIRRRLAPLALGYGQRGPPPLRL